ncbi:2-dehydropantoate 2-reductase N-terminal domain-containing protein [uncultured Clostridium sp.]|uniref:ketopantoate reductase family protein n=1 Tax=uncultured Clostridium sp. TaxID=59620 RepID=UPI0028E76D6A|nr:2-dehydropantoate 2-reductase N-terminal domain-containing protein [uncultured Clostridium sp.]
MKASDKKILIIGAGVIGSIYAVNLSNAGYSVNMLARSRRLTELEEKGLTFYNNKTGSIDRAHVKIINKLYDDDIYDYVFVTVRYEQIEDALWGIKNNCSRNIVTMVNNPFGYGKWGEIVGKEKIIPAFPGAGGKIENGILYYKLTSRVIQPTTFGELSGEKSTRITELYEILKSAGFPISICNNMDPWQKSHLAMVIPMANAIYFDGGDNYSTARNVQAMRNMSLSLKENFNFLKSIGIIITPIKLNIFRICPTWFLSFILKSVYKTKFAETLISNHANNAKHEMDLLSNDFNELAKGNGVSLKYLHSM